MMLECVEPESVTRILQAVLYNSRRVAGAIRAKLDLRDPKGTLLTFCSTEGLIRSIESGIVPRRYGIS